MIKISSALENLLNGNPFLQIGLQDRLFNLSRLAQYLKPLIEVRSKKEVSVSAVHMALSRFQSKLNRRKLLRVEHLELLNVAVQSGLAVLCFHKNRENHARISTLYNKVLTVNGYMTITEGMNETTIIIEHKHLELAKKTVHQSLLHEHLDVSAIGVKFPEKYIHTPGFLYRIIQLITLQGINIIELASTSTELVFYLDTKDVRLAFDTLIAREVRG